MLILLMLLQILLWLLVLVDDDVVAVRIESVASMYCSVIMVLVTQISSGIGASFVVANLLLAMMHDMSSNSAVVGSLE